MLRTAVATHLSLDSRQTTDGFGRAAAIEQKVSGAALSMSAMPAETRTDLYVTSGRFRHPRVVKVVPLAVILVLAERRVVPAAHAAEVIVYSV
jgi:hypothetical protein